jgi:hypothetical protein
MFSSLQNTFKEDAINNTMVKEWDFYLIFRAINAGKQIF